MSVYHLKLISQAGLQLSFSITRSRDDASFDPERKCWLQQKAPLSRSAMYASGRDYEGRLPELEPDEEYTVCVYASQSDRSFYHITQVGKLFASDRSLNSRQLNLLANKKIAMIYDTSFLMNGDLLNVKDHFPSDFSPGSVSLTQIIPLEVKQEIFKHFGDPSKESKAKRARTLVASLLRNYLKTGSSSRCDSLRYQ